MAPDLVWLTIAANAVIAVVTIGNTWMLAWYSKKPKKERKEKSEEPTAKASVTRRFWLRTAALVSFTLMSR